MAKTFEKFVKAVDAALEARCGLGLDDLGDYVDLANAFDEGATAKGTANKIIKENGGEF